MLVAIILLKLEKLHKDLCDMLYTHTQTHTHTHTCMDTFEQTHSVFSNTRNKHFLILFKFFVLS